MTPRTAASCGQCEVPGGSKNKWFWAALHRRQAKLAAATQSGQYAGCVQGKHVTIKVNGHTVVEWTEPEGWQGPQGNPGRKLSSGTFALQGHDPDSVVYFKNIMVKPLP
jgi:hypothetical protein